jgi:hypothetical protein
MIYREYIETEIADHCNLRCKDCSHHSPYMSRGFYEMRQYKEDVAALTKVLHVQGFRIVGGEPFLNRQLLTYVAIARDYGLADAIGVCTNGTCLGGVGEEFMAAIDFLDINTYPLGKKIQTKVDRDTRRLQEIAPHKIKIVRNIDSRVSDSLVRNTDDDLVRDIWRSCHIKRRCHAFYKGYYLRCMISRRKGQFLSAMGVREIELLDPRTDALSLTTEHLEDALVEFIGSDKPLRACAWCLGTSGRRLPHRQLRTDDKMIQTMEALVENLEPSTLR